MNRHDTNAILYCVYILAFVLLASPVRAEENKPTMLIFHADWCGPCQKMKRDVFPALIKEMAGFEVIRVDTDEYPEITKAWKVGGIPCIIFAKREGEEYAVEFQRFTGYQPLSKLKKYLQSLKE